MGSNRRRRTVVRPSGCGPMSRRRRRRRRRRRSINQRQTVVARDLCRRTHRACVVGRRAVFSYGFDGCTKARFTQLQQKLLVTAV